MYCNKLSFQELLDCCDIYFEINLENNAWTLEHNAGEFKEILNGIMQKTLSIITSALTWFSMNLEQYGKGAYRYHRAGCCPPHISTQVYYIKIG